MTSRIKAARQATGDDGETQRVIRTVRGRGYMFVATVAGDEEPGWPIVHDMTVRARRTWLTVLRDIPSSEVGVDPLGQSLGICTGTVDERRASTPQERKAQHVQPGRAHHATVVHESPESVEHRGGDVGERRGVPGRPDHGAQRGTSEFEERFGNAGAFRTPRVGEVVEAAGGREVVEL